MSDVFGAAADLDGVSAMTVFDGVVNTVGWLEVDDDEPEVVELGAATRVDTTLVRATPGDPPELEPASVGAEVAEDKSFVIPVVESGDPLPD